MTDNGSSGGISRDGKMGYNNGFRGMKGAKTDGGHRVPFFIRWPNGHIDGGKDVNMLAAHVDLIPTLASLCQLSLPDEMPLDGIDFSSALFKNKNKAQDRTVFVHHRQDWRPPFAVDQTCIMQDHWRLINGIELYDIERDRNQDVNIAAKYPAVVKHLLQENETFIDTAKNTNTYFELPACVIGKVAQNEIKLTIQHAIGEDGGIWKSEQVAAGKKNGNNTHSITVANDGVYEIACRRWPKECPGPILGIPKENPKNWFYYQAIHPQKVRISIANQMMEKEIGASDEEVTFLLNLQKGKTLLVNDFIEGNEKYGVYYTYIRKLE